MRGNFDKMNELPSQIMPSYKEDLLEDTLFHYTTASGLMGILKDNSIWSTAHYCTNDESELAEAKGILTPHFRNKTYELRKENDRRVDFFKRNNVDAMDHANKFEQTIFSDTLSFLNVYLTSFCKPIGKEDFLHGLLSQWRGYGNDGGYALQFNRKRLENSIANFNNESKIFYDLQDVHYSKKNPLKVKVDSHADKFVQAYMDFLDLLINVDFKTKTMKRPIANLTGGPLESFLDYIICTKNEHFREEKECRMCLLDIASSESSPIFIDHFNRNGLIVPYTKTPVEFNILECVDWIIVGPSPRIESRFNSIRQLVRNLGLNIQVRASHIPFSRY